MSNPVVHWEMITKNPDRAREFYTKLFGWDVDASRAAFQSVETGGINGAIILTEDGVPHVRLVVQVPDLQEALDLSETLGGKTVTPIVDIPGGPSFAVSSDPDCNFIAFVKE
jgi:predicted enzyme related to lactoylglutathione lyase